MNYLDTILLEIKTRLTNAIDYENSPALYFSTISTAYNANLNDPNLPLCEIILGREEVEEVLTNGTLEELSREIILYVRAKYTSTLTPQETYTKAFTIVRNTFKSPNYNFKASMPSYVQSFDYDGTEQASISEQESYIDFIINFKISYLSAMNNLTTGA